MVKFNFIQLTQLIPYLALTFILYFFQNPFEYLTENSLVNEIRQIIFVLIVLFILIKFYLIISKKELFTIESILYGFGLFLGLYFSFNNIYNLLTPDDFFPIWFKVMYVWPQLLGFGIFLYFGNIHLRAQKLFLSCTRKGFAKLIYKEQSNLRVNGYLYYNLTLEFGGVKRIIKNVSNKVALNVSIGDMMEIKYNPKNKKEFIL